MSENRIFTRQRIISSILAILLIVIAINVSGVLSSQKKSPPQKTETSNTNVLCAPIMLVETPVYIQSNGVLRAKDKIDVVSRVQGIFLNSDHPFRSGMAYKKGEVLVQLDNSDFVAETKSQRAQLLQAITAMLPDIKYEFPESFNSWNSYVNSFDITQNTSELPETQSDREKAFVNSKNIITQFYNIKSKELKNEFYRIQAPFNGILTEQLVNKGALVNVGQKLGSFINTSVFELELKISPEELKKIRVGKKVKLSSYQNSSTPQSSSSKSEWVGTVVRINPVIDASSQSALVTIEVSGKGLKEGMYLKADVSTISLTAVAEISRNLLIDEKYIYLIKDSILRKQEVKLEHIADKTVYVSGVNAGDLTLNKPVPGAYDGMKVNPILQTQ